MVVGLGVSLTFDPLSLVTNCYIIHTMLSIAVCCEVCW